MFIDFIIVGMMAYIGISTASGMPRYLKIVYVVLWVAAGVAGAVGAEYHYGFHAFEWGIIAAVFGAAALLIYGVTSMRR